LLTVPPFTVNVPLAAVALSVKSIKPPVVPLAVPALDVNVPLPAVEVLKNSMNPNPRPLTVLPPLAVKEVPLPAVALFVKKICPSDSAAAPPAATKFCVAPSCW
jgi:hypothetical protein